MARIRSIKPQFFRHAGLFDLEQETGLPMRVAFAGLWTAADREGRFKWEPRELKLDCLPHDQVDFSRVLDALATRGFIRKYRVNGVVYGCIPSWADHQIINNRESASELPSPDEASDEQEELTRAPRVADACPTREGNYQGERKGRERKDISASGDAPLELENEFAEWWERYPLKQDKAAAQRAYRKARKKASRETLLTGLETYKRTKEDWRAWKGPAAWLNAERWNDQPASSPTAPLPASDDLIRTNLRGWLDGGANPRAMKHPPGHPDCSIPRHILLEFADQLKQHGYEVAA